MERALFSLEMRRLKAENNLCFDTHGEENRGKWQEKFRLNLPIANE